MPVHVAAQTRRSFPVGVDDLEGVVRLVVAVMVVLVGVADVVDVRDVVLVVVEFGTVGHVRAQFEEVVQRGEQEEEYFDQKLLRRHRTHHHGQEEHEFGGEELDHEQDGHQGVDQFFADVVFWN